MKLLLFRSLWTTGFDLDLALRDVASGIFDGIEGPLPDAPDLVREFLVKLRSNGIPYLSEIVIGGGYVPQDRSPDRQLEEFKRKVETALKAEPLHLTVLAGCDAWPFSVSVNWLGRAIEFARELNVSVSFETHRSRPTFNPWATRSLLDQLPELRLTCDFSHWCCVCERLVLNEERELLELCAQRADHIHARIGYEQGPQVPHPAAPEYEATLAAHENWWNVVWAAQQKTGRQTCTMTPEFGPDGYLQAAPFTGVPVANLDAINRWMAARQRQRFPIQTGAPLLVSAP